MHGKVSLRSWWNLRLLWLLVVLFPLSGCLFRSHKVESRLSTATLKQASEAELINYVNTEAARIQSLNATVDISTSVGGWTKGKVTEYQEIRGYILMRRPSMLRMIGLFPVVRNRAFDMVSNGQTFALSIPAKNKFIVGRNDVILHTNQPLENLRPQHILDALLVREIDPNSEIAVLENSYERVMEPKSKQEVEQPNYVIIVLRHGDQGWYLSRKIMFSRVDLKPHQQIIYDKNGYIASNVRYENFTHYDGVDFPGDISIWRPQEEYSIGLKLVKLTLNQPLTDEQFALQQPPGSQLVRLDVAGQSTQSSQSPTCCGNGKPQ